MKQTLQFRASQQLAMTPQLQFSIRLLQLSTFDFEREINQALAANPLLERDENAADATLDIPSTPRTPEETRISDEAVPLKANEYDDAYPDGPSGWQRHDDEQEFDIGSYTPTPISLRDHLLEQVRTSKLSPRDRALVTTLVDALDECGYLRQSLDELHALLPTEVGVTPEELAVALRFLQSLDPIGIGARSLAECLVSQLEQLPADHPGRTLALAIVRDHLPLLAANDSIRLKRALGCDETALREANGLIKRLDPHPGLRFSTPDDTRYVVADVIVSKAKDKWVATINPEVLPRIQVNRSYAEILKNNRSGVSSLLGQKLQEARWMIRIVQQRFQTIQRVAQAIVDRQHRFFDHGEIALRPLVLRDIADTLGLHDSTVSRVTSNKYMATPRGVLELKYFFCSRIVSEQGNDYSATAIRALIKRIIGFEDACNPLSDIKITRMLSAQGIEMARRTVTKYRDVMRIPPLESRRLSAPYSVQQ